MKKQFDLEKTILKDENGQNIMLFHSTDTKIERFYPLSHFGTEEASSKVTEDIYRSRYRYSTEEELIQKIYQESLQKDNPPKYNIDYGKYLVYLSMSKPLKMTDIGLHSEPKKWGDWLEQKYWNQSSFKDRYSDDDTACRYAQSLYRFIFENPNSLSDDDLRYELSMEKLYNPTEKGKDDSRTLKKRVQFQRLIRYLEQEGFDGVEYRNAWEDEGSTSYIIFRPEQVFFLGEEGSHSVLISDSCDEILKKQQNDFLKEEIKKPYVKDKAKSKMEELFGKIQGEMKKRT